MPADTKHPRGRQATHEQPRCHGARPRPGATQSRIGIRPRHRNSDQLEAGEEVGGLERGGVHGVGAVGRVALDAGPEIAADRALFGLGGVLYRYRPEGDVKAILYICAVSLVLHPIVVWTVGRSVSLDLEAFRSSVLTAAMAPGINAYLFASMYGAARRVAASSVLIGTTLSILTIWCWLLILP